LAKRLAEKKTGPMEITAQKTRNEPTIKLKSSSVRYVVPPALGRYATSDEVTVTLDLSVSVRYVVPLALDRDKVTVTLDFSVWLTNETCAVAVAVAVVGYVALRRESCFLSFFLVVTLTIFFSSKIMMKILQIEEKKEERIRRILQDSGKFFNFGI
jgi:hypothetical protein